MKLNSLIDFLPYAYKDLDTYKVNGKGLLERYLEIFGDYFQDIITSDIDSLQEILDIDNTPAYYLNYLWEFLGELPFANTPIISQEVWETYFAGFKDDATIEQLCNQWLNNRSGVLEFDTDKVRQLLKCSIALFKIRGTKEFFEILFRLYGLNISISDPVGTDTNLWIPDLHPLHDDPDMVYDKDITFDNLYRCTQCVAVPITISGHGFSSASDEFLSFKRSIDALFERFLPYNARPEINYGVTLNYNYKITAVAQITPTLIQGEVSEIPILVTVTANKEYGDIDLRYQVSGDGVTWSTTKYNSPSLYYGKREGTLYFRAVGDETKVATVTINKQNYIRQYNLWGEWSDGGAVINNEIHEIKEGEKSVKITLNGSVAYRGNNTQNLPIRRTDTNEIKNGPAEWEFDEFGEHTYTFALVDFPTRSLTVTIRKIQEYEITCNPEIQTVSTEEEATTRIEIKTKYPHNDDSPFEAVEVNNSEVIIESGSNFKISEWGMGFGTYKFKCTEDNNGKDTKYATYVVMKADAYTIVNSNLRFLNTGNIEILPTGGVSKSIQIDTNLLYLAYLLNQTYYDSIAPGFHIDLYRNGNKLAEIPVTLIPDSSDIWMIFQASYNITETGTYYMEFPYSIPQFANNKIKSPNYIFTVEAPEAQLYIKPQDYGDSAWTLNDPDYPTEATYKLDNLNTCSFWICFTDPSYDGILVTKSDDGKVYTTGGEPDLLIEWSKDDIKQGTYTFTTQSLEPPQSVKLTITKNPPAYTIWCEPATFQLSQSDSWARTTVYLTMNPADTSGEYSYDVYLNGQAVYHDANPVNGGWEFETQATGVYTFVCKDNPSLTCTFTVEGIFSASPIELTWEATDTSEKEITITTTPIGDWTATLE